MKTTKKLTYKNFRYLTKKEVKNPLYGIADFCRTVISLGEYQDKIQEIIRISCTSPKGIKPRRYSNVLFYWKYLVRQIELLNVLAHRKLNWSIQADSKYYKLNVQFGRGVIYDETLYNGSYLNFEQLKEAEMKNIGVFIDKFFKFKSLRQWYEAMDTLFETLFEDDTLHDLSDFADDQTKIFNYLEKLAEAIFLIYAIEAKQHIFKHYVAEFRLEKFLKEEPSETEIILDDNEPVEFPNLEST